MTYKINHLRRVLDEPAPCDNCTHKQRCGDYEMACRVFSSYVINGTYKLDTPRNPTCSLYNKIFIETDEKALKEFLKSFNDTQEDLFDLVADKTLR